jgi:hypothetical protein
MKKMLLLFIILLCGTISAQRKSFKNMTEKNGNIGIGTKSPDALLTVKGEIHTREVLVDLEGALAPDYVFEAYFEGVSKLNPAYTLPSLKEVGLCVAAHHHLPGVPPAATLAKEGMALKEMNLTLLEKVEELTLYLLEQQKEIEALKEKYASLKE